MKTNTNICNGKCTDPFCDNSDCTAYWGTVAILDEERNEDRWMDNMMTYKPCNACESGKHDKCQIFTAERMDIICTCECEK